MIKDIVPEIVEEIQPDAIQLMYINDIPELKKITGCKVVYDVFIDIQWIDAQENAGTLTEEKLRTKIRKELTEQAAGGALWLMSLRRCGQRFSKCKEYW